MLLEDRDHYGLLSDVHISETQIQILMPHIIFFKYHIYMGIYCQWSELLDTCDHIKAQSALMIQWIEHSVLQCNLSGCELKSD